MWQVSPFRDKPVGGTHGVEVTAETFVSYTPKSYIKTLEKPRFKTSW
jgi:hypothetical protein